jgi:hypothetical protein
MPGFAIPRINSIYRDDNLIETDSLLRPGQFSAVQFSISTLCTGGNFGSDSRHGEGIFSSRRPIQLLGPPAHCIKGGPFPLLIKQPGSQTCHTPPFIPRLRICGADLHFSISLQGMALNYLSKLSGRVVAEAVNRSQESNPGQIMWDLW